MDETDVRAGSDQNQLNYHASLQRGTEVEGIILCDGKGRPDARGIRFASMPRTAMQIQQGDPDYSGFELPYTPIVQRDFSGGRGNEDYERDKTRYADSLGVDTSRGDIVLSPKVTKTLGGGGEILSPFTEDSQIDELKWTDLYSSYIPPSNFALKSIILNAYAAGVSVILHSDDNGVPTTNMLAYGSSTVSPEFPELRCWVIPINYNLVQGTRYWFEICFAEPPGGECYGWKDDNAPGLKIYTYDENSLNFTLYQDNASITYQLSSISPTGPARFFEYKGQLYAVTNTVDGSAPKLWMNGYRGKAESNVSEKGALFTKMTLDAETDLVGKIIKITAGPGYEEDQNWRVIIGWYPVVDTNHIQVSPPWNITHTTATEFVILGCDTWQEITNHGLSAVVTDVLVYDDIVYFAQGGGKPIRRGQLTTAWAWADDGSNVADLLALIPDTEGKLKIWRAIRATAKVSSSDVKAWGNNLAFGNEIVCGNPRTRINGLAVYGEPLIPWVLKEDSIGSIQNGIYAEIPIGEMRSVRSELNGRAWLPYGVYLYFSLLDGVEKFYENRLDDCGPNRDEGFPSDRKGEITHMISFPGRIFAAIDAGEGGVSSIQCYNQIGWHEIYRSSSTGLRITRMFVQVIPGASARLWFSEGEEINWLPISLNPQTQNDHKYHASGELITAWVYGGYKEIKKFFKSITLFTENLVDKHQTIDVYYRTDNEDASWTLAGAIYASPVQELNLSTNMDVTGRRLQIKLALKTDDPTKTPRIKALTIDTITRIPQKRSWTITMLLDDEGTDLQGGLVETVAARLARLYSWSDSAQATEPIYWRHPHTMMDKVRVFIDTPSINPIYVVSSEQPHKVKLICTMTLYEA